MYTAPPDTQTERQTDRQCTTVRLVTWRFMSYQQCTRFQTTRDFGRKYLRNGSNNRQAENAISNYDFSTFDENNLASFGPLT